MAVGRVGPWVVVSVIGLLVVPVVSVAGLLVGFAVLVVVPGWEKVVWVVVPGWENVVLVAVRLVLFEQAQVVEPNTVGLWGPPARKEVVGELRAGRIQVVTSLFPVGEVQQAGLWQMGEVSSFQLLFHPLPLSLPLLSHPVVAPLYPLFGRVPAPE